MPDTDFDTCTWSSMDELCDRPGDGFALGFAEGGLRIYVPRCMEHESEDSFEDRCRRARIHQEMALEESSDPS